MSEVRVKGTLLNPLGAPVPDGIFRFTAIRISEQIIPSVEAEYTTDSLGQYDFNLRYGTYHMEVLIKDEYHLIADVTIDSGTPNPIDIVNLSHYSAVVPPPVVIPGDPDWEQLHEDLRTDPHMNRRDIGEQIRDGDTYSATLKSLFISDTADMAEETQSIGQGTTTKLEATRNTYNDHANQESSIDKLTLSTRSGKYVRSHEVYTSSVGVDEYYDVQEYKDTDTVLSNNTTFDGSSITVNTVRTKQSNGVTVTEVVDNSGISMNELARFTAPDSLVEMHKDYAVSLVAGKPTFSKNFSTDYTHDLSTASIVDTADLHIDANNNLVGTHTKGLTVLGKETYEKFENDGSVAKRTVKADITSYVGTDDVELVEMDSVNNTMTVKGRLIVTNPDDFKGPAGESQYQELQYSIDGLGNWHDVFTLADKWRRHRNVVNGVVGAWSEGYLLQAEDGHAGDTIYIEYNYAPTTTGPWEEAMGKDDIWRIERRVTNGIPGVWSAPARIRGFNGDEGWITDRVYQYAVRATDPDSMWHSNFSTGDHWRREKLVIYYNHENFQAGKPDIDPGFWVNITQIVPINGVDYGVKHTTVFLYQRKATKPAPPSGELVYNFTDLSITPASNLNGWQTEPYDGTDHMWIAVAVATTQKETDTIAAAEWSISQWSTSGQTLAVSTLFAISNTKPALQFTKAVQDMETGITTVVGTNPQGWSGVPPANPTPGSKMWYCTNAKLVADTVAEHEVAEYSDPVIFLVNGIEGTDGKPGLNGQGSFIFTGAAGTAKPTSAQVEADVKRVAGRDPKDGDSATYYFGTVTDSRSTQYDFLRQGGSWVTFTAVTNGNSIVHGTIVAQHIRAATFTGDEFSAAFTMRAGTGNNIAVMSGAGAWRFWAGNATATSAPFRVDQAGNLYATKANITGAITATSGKFYNVAIGQNSTSNTGIFVSGDAMVVKDASGRVRVKIGKLT